MTADTPMTAAPAAAANADQLAYWGGPVGDRWALLQAEIDAAFAPLTRAVLAAAAPQAGEHVIDVGCGCGAVLTAVADAVGRDGRVTGIDLSSAMLEVARRRAADRGQVDVVEADASRHGFAPGSLDLLVSRLGVMFFDDPVGAFGHLRSALKPGGRLAFVCWQAMADNVWFAVPVAAVTPLVGPQPPADPLAPGPFAFADADRLRGILADAGFSDIAIASHRMALPLGAPGNVAGAAAFLGQIGAAARLLGEAEPAVANRGRAAIAAAVAPYDGPEGVLLPAAVWVVTARR